MTRRLWMVFLWSGAALCLLPGCKHLLEGGGIWMLGPTVTSDQQDVQSTGGRQTKNDAADTRNLPVQFVIESPPNPWNDEKQFPPSVLVKRGNQNRQSDLPAEPPWLPKIPQIPENSGAIDSRRSAYGKVGAVRSPDQLPPWLRQPWNGKNDVQKSGHGKPPVVPGPVLPPIDLEPPAAALHYFLLNRHEDAIKELKDFDPDRQEFFLRLLPVIALLNRKKLEELNQQEIAVLFEQLDGLLGELRRRAKVVIEQICFCESIDGFGTYNALAHDHSFRARRGGHPGELAQLYVQLRNLSAERRGSHFETCISSSVRIKDKNGREWWYFDFQDRNTPALSRAPRRDFFRNYRFQVPSLPPGDYVLTLEVKDVTRSEAIRSASRSIPFRVGQ